jgi:hypothetical protein
MKTRRGPEGDRRPRPQHFYDTLIETGLLEMPEALRLFYRLMEVPPGEVDIDSPEYRDVEEGDRRKIKELVFIIRDLAGDTSATNKDVTELFQPTEMFSPFEQTLRHATSASYHEVAVISLGENYWANLLRKKGEPPRYASIFVAGVNEMSTTAAVRVLGNKEELRKHPLGGLLDIWWTHLLGPRRMAGARHKWFTREYEAHEVLKKVSQIPQQSSGKREGAFGLFEEKGELELYKELVEQHCPKRAETREGVTKGVRRG